MSAWKWVGLAGLAGVAATGAVVARDQRRRTQMSPEDVRRRLHQRLEDLDRVETALVDDDPVEDGAGDRAR